MRGFKEFIESTGTVGAAAAGQWADDGINGPEFARKLGVKRSRPKHVMWDGNIAPPTIPNKDPRRLFGYKT